MTILKAEPHLSVLAFSEIGQNLNNAFDVYRETIQGMSTDAIELTGLAVSGEDEAVRRATRKFSVL